MRKKDKPLEIADWAKAEQRQQRRKEQQLSLFAHVRLIFVLLFFATIFVFATNRQQEVQHFLSAKITPMVQKLPGGNGLRAKALKYERDVDQINQPNQQSSQQN